jgi:oligoribonuclease NrnB/cAMP/cGMP phosphodiesterase (DHH superfamily)
MAELRKPILFTHTDLDGVACAVIFQALFPDAVVHFVEYDELDMQMEKLKDAKARTLVYVTDLSPSNQAVCILDHFHCHGGELHLIDHHKTSLSLRFDYTWAHVDVTASGAQLLLNYLLFKIPDSAAKLEIIAASPRLWTHTTAGRWIRRTGL